MLRLLYVNVTPIIYLLEDINKGMIEDTCRELFAAADELLFCCRIKLELRTVKCYV